MVETRKPGRTKPRRLPLWARIAGVIVGALVVLWTVQVRDALGGLELLVGVAIGLVIIACSLVPARRGR
jgi:uncharacterized membrane protein YdcZ (DUF606 family)